MILEQLLANQMSNGKEAFIMPREKHMYINDNFKNYALDRRVMTS